MNFDDLHQTDEVLFLRYAVGLMKTENIAGQNGVGIWEAHSIRICWGVPHHTSPIQIWLSGGPTHHGVSPNHCLTRNAGPNSGLSERLSFARSYLTYLRSTRVFERFEFRTITLITAILAWNSKP